MKTVIKLSVLFVMFVTVILTCVNIDFIKTTKAEMNDTAEISMRNVLKGSTVDVMYDMSISDMEVELIRNIGINTNVDNELTVDIYELNKNGLIDLSLSSKFKHVNGVEDTRTLRKTMIMEQFPK